jgi:hypothetical protein
LEAMTAAATIGFGSRLQTPGWAGPSAPAFRRGGRKCSRSGGNPVSSEKNLGVSRILDDDKILSR